MILDTSFLIDLLRGKDQKVKEKVEKIDSEFGMKTVTSITIMELWRGAIRSIKSEEEKKKIDNLLKALLICDFKEKDAKKAGEIEANLIKEGSIIDLEDIMIAGIAISRDEKIISRNIKHFNRIKNLKIETY